MDHHHGEGLSHSHWTTIRQNFTCAECEARIQGQRFNSNYCSDGERLLVIEESTEKTYHVSACVGGGGARLLARLRGYWRFYIKYPIIYLIFHISSIQNTLTNSKFSDISLHLLGLFLKLVALPLSVKKLRFWPVDP
jgi:hypothetical protein